MKSSNKVYVISGSTSGIGLELVKNLSKDNKVYCLYRNELHLEKLKNISANIQPVRVEMSDINSIDNASDFILSQVDKIDTLINVAGCVVAGAVEELDIEKVKYQFDVNTFSHLRLTQRLLNKLDGGKVINISSMASFGIFPLISPYCASKRALDIFFNSLQIEYGDSIRFVSVKPGVIATPLWDKSVECNSDLKNEKYNKEYTFLFNNAKKNGKNGLNVNKVVDCILKIDTLKNPKASYTVGYDAKIAEIFSKLPQGLINKIVKFGLKSRVK